MFWSNFAHDSFEEHAKNIRFCVQIKMMMMMMMMMMMAIDITFTA